MATTPDYLICIECETPCYEFEWADGQLIEVMCLACGNEDVDTFATQEDLDAMIGGTDH